MHVAEPIERTETRCAIYTRKSTERGLDREMNSLEAHRQTCEAYIRRQAHKNWTELPKLMTTAGRSHHTGTLGSGCLPVRILVNGCRSGGSAVEIFAPWTACTAMPTLPIRQPAAMRSRCKQG